MNSWLRRHRWPLAVLLVVAAIGGALGASGAMRGMAQPTVLPPETAVRRAIEISRHSMPGGGILVGAPRSIRGQVMTYNQAQELRDGRTIAPSEGIWKLRDRLVWVVAIEGAIENPDSPRKNTQMILVLDAETADLMGISERSAGREINTTSLATLAEPKGPVPTPMVTPQWEVPTPAPTRPPAPPAPTR